MSSSSVSDVEIEVYLSLGSDIGDRDANLRGALDALDEAFGVHCDLVSRFYETEPWGFESDTQFLNAAVKYILAVPRGTDPAGFVRWILGICKGIESSMGRTGKPEYDSSGNRIYRSRIIDIDILMAGAFLIDEPDLKVPHPLMAQRDFVMIPLMDIASPEIKGIFPWIFDAK